MARGARGTKAVLITPRPSADTPLVRALRAASNVRLEVHDAAEKPDLGTLGGNFLVLDGVMPDLTNLPPRTPVLIVNPQTGGSLLNVTAVSNTIGRAHVSRTRARATRCFRTWTSRACSSAGCP